MLEATEATKEEEGEGEGKNDDDDDGRMLNSDWSDSNLARWLGGRLGGSALSASTLTLRGETGEYYVVGPIRLESALRVG